MKIKTNPSDSRESVTPIFSFSSFTFGDFVPYPCIMDTYVAIVDEQNAEKERS